MNRHYSVVFLFILTLCASALATPAREKKALQVATAWMRSMVGRDATRMKAISAFPMWQGADHISSDAESNGACRKIRGSEAGEEQFSDVALCLRGGGRTSMPRGSAFVIPVRKIAYLDEAAAAAAERRKQEHVWIAWPVAKPDPEESGITFAACHRTQTIVAVSFLPGHVGVDFVAELQWTTCE